MPDDNAGRTTPTIFPNFSPQIHFYFPKFTTFPHFLDWTIPIKFEK